jgi:EAL domain-containing protein (putative c-di-GMP-specific phosphodiesterase class I)
MQISTVPPGEPSTHSSLLDVLVAPGALRPVFQPIVDVSGTTPRLHALEGLTRGPVGTELESADVLFDCVRRRGWEQLVDRICIDNALDVARAFPATTRFSLNVHLATLVGSHGFVNSLAAALDRNGVSPTRLTLEIVEHAAPCATGVLAQALDRLRSSGIQIALDDIGSGASNFRMLVDLRPDYVKIDRYIIDGINGDPYRRAVVESIVELGGRIGARVVVEGVAVPAQLTLLRSLGVKLAQGHLFACAAGASELRHHRLLRSAAA